MSQTAYNRDHAVAMAGMKADAGFDRVESFTADGAIPFGRGVAYEAGNVEKVRLPAKDIATLLYDGDFVTSNKINGTVNGVAWTEVDFDTDQATTLAALIAAVDAMDGVSATAGAARTVVIEMDNGEAITVTTVVTGGASQATGTPTYSGDDIFRGISLQTHKEQNAAGVVQYADKETVSTARQGVFWIETSKAVTADSDAYVLKDGTGKFTDASSGNLATGGKFRSTVAAAGLAKVEVNIP